MLFFPAMTSPRSLPRMGDFVTLLCGCARMVTAFEVAAVTGAGSHLFTRGRPEHVHVSLNFSAAAHVRDVCVQAVPACACGLTMAVRSECTRMDDTGSVLSFTYTVQPDEDCADVRPDIDASGHLVQPVPARCTRACCRHELELWLAFFGGTRLRVCTVREVLCVRHLVEPASGARTLDVRALTHADTLSCTSARVHTGLCVSHCGTWLALMPAVTSVAISVYILNNNNGGSAACSAARAEAEFQLPVQSMRVFGCDTYGAVSQRMSVVHATCCFTAAASLLVCATASTARASYVAHYTRDGVVLRVFHNAPRGARWVAAPRNKSSLFVTANAFGQMTVLTLEDEMLTTYSAGGICWGLAARWDTHAHALQVASINDGPQLTTTDIHFESADPAARACAAPVHRHSKTSFAFPRGWKLTALNAADELVLTSATGYLPTEPFIEVLASGTNNLNYRMLPNLKRPVCALAMSNHAAYILDDAGHRIVVLTDK
jgi:hypothetical protein